MSSERMPPDDHELDDFLAGRHPVSRAYRDGSENESAPPELDAAILAAAREAVRTPVVRRPRWVQPVALAATLVLGLSVLMNVWRDPQLREQAVPAAASMPEPMSEPTHEDRVVEMRGAPSGAAEAAAAKPAPPAGSQEKKKAERWEARPEAPAAASMAAPPPPPAPSTIRERDERDPVLHDRSDSYAPQSLEPSMAPPSADTDTSAVPAETEDAPRAGRLHRSIDELLSRPSYKLAPDAAMRSAPAAAEDPSGAPGAAAGGSHATESAQRWIERIRAELLRGDEAGARRSLAEFRQSYPDFELPEDLRRLETP